jgi:hypothetical protein
VLALALRARRSVFKVRFIAGESMQEWIEHGIAKHDLLSGRSDGPR